MCAAAMLKFLPFAHWASNRLLYGWVTSSKFHFNRKLKIDVNFLVTLQEYLEIARENSNT